jgi:thiamine pyrophosphokinase
MGIAPSLIIGDLDSTPYRLQQQYPCVQIADQSSSDFQKALIYLREHELLPAIILGVNGGYLDHILCNLAIFAQEGDCLLYDSPHMMGVALDVGEYRYEHWPVNSKFSLIGAPEATVSSQGLKWELRHERLSMWDIRSFFHRTSAEEVVFKVHEGRLVVLLYLEAISDAGGE